MQQDILHIHNDDLSGPTSGHFGNIYYTWDQMKSIKRDVDDRQINVAMGTLAREEKEVVLG